ncbi:MAG: excinuclease ATPase subunit [Betaproteobacteria bacterium]|nr:excinuclease ATPase subunit [Betaproteobacteria bacterium]
MKAFIKAFVVLFVSLPLCAAHARNTTHYLPIKGAIEMDNAKEQSTGDIGIGAMQISQTIGATRKIAGDIGLFFADQSHPGIEAVLTKDVVAYKKASAKAAYNSDEEACNLAMQSALTQLQERARKEGGNAVINIESYYKKKSFRSQNQFECHAGNAGAGVALKGNVVKLKH